MLFWRSPFPERENKKYFTRSWTFQDKSLYILENINKTSNHDNYRIFETNGQDYQFYECSALCYVNFLDIEDFATETPLCESNSS